jgi:hypothetical protein
MLIDHMNQGGLLRDEMMAPEPIYEWNPLGNINEGLINGSQNSQHHNMHEDSYFNFDMKI